MNGQYRYYTPATELRAVGDGRTIDGYAFLWETRSVLLPDWEHGRVYEEITRGALDAETLASSDVVANINHDDDKMLARFAGGTGSLRLELDDRGLRMSFEAAPTMWGDYALEGVRRGDFRGMSFGFVTDGKDFRYTREDGGKERGEVYVRHLDKIRSLFDVSIVTHPAYPSTTVEARSAGVLEGLRSAGLLPTPAPFKAVRGDYDALGAWLRGKR